MTLDLLDLVTLIAAIIVGGYIVLFRRVHALSHGWCCALWHLGAAALCAGAAVDALHARAGAWLLGVVVVIVWLVESHHTWRNERPRQLVLRRMQTASSRAARSAVAERGGGLGEE